MHTVVDTPPDWTEERLSQAFWTYLLGEAMENGGLQWENYDMVSAIGMLNAKYI